MSGNFIVAVLMSSALTRTLKAAASSSSFDGVKRVKSLFSKMKKTRFDQSEPESPRQISGPDGTERKSTVSKIGKMGPVCKARNKTAEVVIEFVEQEEIDLDEQIDYRLHVHVSVDEWMISWSSTLAKSDVHLDKASSISDKSRALNPDQEDESSERTGPDLEVFLQEDLKEETRFRLISEPCRRKTDFYVHLDKASSISDKSRTPNPEEDESSERTGPELEMFLQEDFEEENPTLFDFGTMMSFSVSFLSLDGDDSTWTPDTELESDILKSSFPSPSCRRSLSSEAFSSSSSDFYTLGKFKERTFAP
ncbi:hypothetical protein OIU77_002976 [Salix suchowensis]|uniref:Uncharacterized protein n=1 Tax=Salix suchowensis TaxID=1278906 RepID=A0ABQ9AY10_9ROSI|nr:hypothetical protein OIU77_002976 [Salix suchowensis]